MSRNFPDWIGSYLEYTKYSEAPSKFHFWTAVGVIAGALRRRVWIDQRYFQWVPNFYIFFVSPPGVVSKSTTVDVGMSLLREVPGIKFGPSSLTWQYLTKAMGESTESLEMPGSGEITPMSAITIVASELGSLFDFENREMIDVFVDLWDGKKGTWHRGTKTQGEDKIANPFLNVIGCTTPAWVRDNFSRYLLGQGFTSRSIFVFGHQKRQLVAYPADAFEADKALAEHRIKLLQDLEMISMLLGEYRLAPDAKVWGSEWYKKHYERYLKTDPNDEGMTSFLARKQTQLHKLAMVLAASKRDDLVITIKDMEIAETMLTAVEGELPEVFGRIAERDEVRDAVAVVQFLATHGRVERLTLYRNFFNRMSVQQFDMALASIVQAQRAKIEQVGVVTYITYIPQEKDRAA